MKKPIILRRAIPENQIKETWNADAFAHPILRDIYLSRGVLEPQELEKNLQKLHPYHSLLNINSVVALLYQALLEEKRIMIVGDFDADGATSTTLAVKALLSFGILPENILYLVPNRFEYGYGLSPEIVEKAAEQNPDLIITVDNGISSCEGVALAKSKGISVLITDHHLPGEILPEADVIINPNQKGDDFPSKNLAGVGVIFYVMLALRAYLREKGWFESKKIQSPNMVQFLDLVALGTVADVVPLDQNNRILVHFGLENIRAGKTSFGIKALLKVGKRQIHQLVSSDLGFTVGPRLNAAGRLEDMSIGIACLLADNPTLAEKLAIQLDGLNKERQSIEHDMHGQSFEILEKMNYQQDPPMGVCLYHKDWHQGVVGILAARVKEQVHRPVIIFTNSDENEIKGSARSIPGLHIRDVLDEVATQNPELISKFGGHAMAAGLSLPLKNFDVFKDAFNLAVSNKVKADDLCRKIWTDGSLNKEDFKLDMAVLLQNAGPWGQNFPEPLFDNEFILLDQRILAEKYLKLLLKHPESDKTLDAIAFKVDIDEWPDYNCQKVRVLYRLDVNEYRDVRRLQLMVEYVEKGK